MTADELAEEKRHVREKTAEDEVNFREEKGQGRDAGKPTRLLMVLLAWTMDIISLS
jgi:hypothetical protein